MTTLDPVVIYKHRGDVGPLDRLLTWWVTLDTEVPLIVRLDEDDPSLPGIDTLCEKYDSDPWTCIIGPPCHNQGELALEFYNEWKGQADRLVYVTDSPSSIATFIMAYENQNRRER